MSKQIKASEFKAKCLKLMDEIAQSGEELIITKNGKPVAKLVAADDPKKERPSPFGILRGKLHVKDWDDLEKPVIDPDRLTYDEENIYGLNEDDEKFDGRD